MTRLTLCCAAALLVVACGTADASPELVEIAVPLVRAHEALEQQAALVEADRETAVATWPAVEVRVTAAVEELPEPSRLGLEPRDRSTLIGYARGLEVALAAWAEVHALLADGDLMRANRATDAARARTRHLERLRAGVTP